MTMGAATIAGSISPLASVHPDARIGANVEIGPFTVIGADVEIGDGTRIGPHCSIHGPTRIGRDNRIHGHAAIGGDPQDKKFAGERTELVIGDGNMIREFVTINRGTGSGGGITRVGHRNWFLAYVHVAHDCIVGDDCVFSNNATLAGHVEVGNHVILSGFAGVHQFCRIGAHAFIGMGAFVNGDVPPYLMVAQEDYGRPRGINSEGLQARLPRAVHVRCEPRGRQGPARRTGQRQRRRPRFPGLHRARRAPAAALRPGIGMAKPPAPAHNDGVPLVHPP